jgi:uncharacterized protein (TIGR02118 family)
MHKLLVFYPHPQDERKFRPYYENVHLPMAAKLPGLKAWRYSLSINAPDGGSPFYCLFEAEFADESAMAAAMQSEAGQKVEGDVANFTTTPPMVVHYEVAAP